MANEANAQYNQVTIINNASAGGTYPNFCIEKTPYSDCPFTTLGSIAGLTPVANGTSTTIQANGTYPYLTQLKIIWNDAFCTNGCIPTASVIVSAGTTTPVVFMHCNGTQAVQITWSSPCPCCDAIVTIN